MMITQLNYERDMIYPTRLKNGQKATVIANLAKLNGYEIHWRTCLYNPVTSEIIETEDYLKDIETTEFLIKYPCYNAGGKEFIPVPNYYEDLDALNEILIENGMPCVGPVHYRINELLRKCA